MVRDTGQMPDDVIGGGNYMPASAVPRLKTADSPVPMANSGAFSINSSRSMPERDDLRQPSSSRGNRVDNKRLYAVRMSRKQAEEDVVTMRNRIKRLQLEEDRARKNIEETRRRADNIVRLKAQNELKARQREQERMQMALQNKMDAHQKSLERAQREANIKANKQFQIKQKQQMVKDLRAESLENARATMEHQRRDTERAARLKQDIYNKARKAVHDKHLQRHLQQVRVVQRYEERMMEEERIGMEREEEIQQLEQHEAALLHRLRQAQELQRGAYTELEVALDV